LPFAQARLAWWILLLACTILIVWAVVELTALPLLLVGVCIAASVLLQSLPSGALAPLPIALLCVSAVAFIRGRYTVAAILLGVSFIEPHMAVAPFLAAFVLVPRMRVRLALVAAAIFVISLAAGGLRLNLEYLLSVLPAHAASELGTAGQYGLSSMLHAAGLPDHASLVIGSLQYALFVLVGLWFAYVLRRDMPEALVLAPMAFAVTGGTFVHLTQIAGAVPFALAVASRTRSPLAWAAVTLVTIPWQSTFENGTVPLAGLVLLAIVAYRRVHWILPLAFAVGLVAGVWFLRGSVPPPAAIAPIPQLAPTALPEIAWRELADQFPPTMFSWIGHALTYLGLACLYLSALLVVRVPAAKPEVATARG
jgi:hypothetical protein